MKKLKVIQIGIGHDHARDAAKRLAARNDVEFAGLVVLPEDTDVPKKWYETELTEIPRLTLEEALAIPDLDAVFVETADKFLTKSATMCVERGLPVQMDKPGSQNEEEFDRMLDLAKEKGLPFHLGYMYRYNPAVLYARKLKEEGKLGKIQYIEANMSCIHNEDKRRWLADYRGGMLYFLGCHLVDLCVMFQGEPKKVYAFNRSTAENVGEDMGTALLEYDTGVSVVRTTAVEHGGYLRRRVLIVGEKGSVYLDPTEASVPGTSLQTTNMFVSLENELDWFAEPEKTAFPPYDRYNAMFDEFFSIVRGEIENPYSYEYEKLVHRVLMRACGGNGQ